MKNRKKNNENFFRESLKYLKSSKKYIYLVAFVFFASSLIGFVFPNYFSFFDDLIAQLVDKTEGMGFGELTWFIFSNNIVSSFLGLILGVFFGIFSIFNSLFNGILLGYVYNKAASVAGLGIGWHLLPHGIFELPAIFISLGLGVKLGTSFFSKAGRKVFFERLKFSIKTFLTFVLPLLVIAAIIESLLIVYL